MAKCVALTVANLYNLSIEKNKMIKVFVTGATGYIGSHVCKKLKEDGYEVIGLDRVRREHTLQYMDQFIEADYHSQTCIDALVQHAPQAVIHLAGTSLVGPSVSDPGEYYTNNVAKTAALLNAIRFLEHMPVVVFSSSAAVYGAPEKDLIHENDPYSPLSPYGQSKAMIEIMLTDFFKAYGMCSASLRYFNACGADESGTLGQAPGATHIVARLLESARDKTKFTLYGNDYNTADGTCVRDYVHVSDLASAHSLAVSYLMSDMDPCFALNLGTGQGYSNQEVIDTVIQTVGSVDISVGPRRAGDPDQLVAGNVLAKAKLGWHPENSNLSNIVTSAWKWYNNPSNQVDN
jgi:UDP-glucose-4-epimerase GalE